MEGGCNFKKKRTFYTNGEYIHFVYNFYFKENQILNSNTVVIG